MFLEVYLPGSIAWFLATSSVPGSVTDNVSGFSVAFLAERVLSKNSCLGTNSPLSVSRPNLAALKNPLFILCRFSGTFMEKRTFEEFVDFCEQIRKE